MKNIWVMVLAFLLVSTAAYANEGKLIASVGTVAVVRDGQEAKLERGGIVRTGDFVKVATDSAAQIRMSDQSIIALGQSTEFRIGEYAFSAENPSEGRAAFSLVKGALRTITGLIGQHARDRYAVKAGSVATIGIRGTHYRLRLCDNDCASEGGVPPANGLYGGVTEGLIGVTNDTGTDEFGPGEYFYVADAATRPERLSGYPGQLMDEQAGFIARAGGSGTTTVATEAPTLGRDQAAAAVLMHQTASTMAADALSGLVLGQFRPAEFASSPSQLAHVSPIVPGAGDGFVNVGGTGDIRGQIVWMTNADIDLHLLTPGASHIYYGNSTVTLTGGAVARLDHDNLGGVIDVAPDKRVENIVVNGTQFPVGQYAFYAHSYSGNNNGLPTVVQIRVTGNANATSLTDSATLSSGQNSSNYLVNIGGGGVAPTYSIQPR